MNEIQKRILNELQVGLPVVERPFFELSKRLGVDEDTLIQEIKLLLEEGYIRRIGPIIDTNKVGMVGALVAIAVPDDRVDQVAAFINRFDEVSHNYLRVADGIPYNLWFTISAKSQNELDRILDKIRENVNHPMITLPTRRIFKIGVEFRV